MAETGFAAMLAGRLVEARSILTDVLAKLPGHGGVHHALGLIAKAEGDSLRALRHLEQAAAALPYDRTVQLNFGNLLVEAARPAEARRAFERALGPDPAWPPAVRGLAVALRSLDAPAEALAVLRRGLAIAPNDDQLWLQFGKASLALDDGEAALDAFERAARLAPGNGAVLQELAANWRSLEQPDRAEGALRRVLAVAPGNAKARSDLAAAIMEQGRAEEGLAMLEPALPLLPKDPDLLVTKGYGLRMLGRLAEAEAAWRDALALDPECTTASMNLHVLAADRLDLPEARRILAGVRERNPDHAWAGMLEGCLTLLEGDFTKGWQGFEHRLQARATRHFAMPGRRWEGESLTGRTLFVEAEEGLGDSIQFIRYAADLAALADEVVVRVPGALVPLFARSFPALSFVGHDDAVPSFDYRIEMMSLPLRFDTRLETIPAPIPYLAAAPETVANWRTRLGSARGLRVGLAWAGNPRHRNDCNRSIPIETLASLVAVPGAAFFSLQVGSRAADLARLPAGSVTDLALDLTGWDETAAALEALDLVIAVDTSVAHLAGALGRPVWLLLPYAPDWRWLLGRDDSPWYPTMRLFRQTAPQDWATVVTGVGAALRQAIGPRSATAGT
jgi:tetratricopeptide (TPR) repeat protein